MKRALLIAYHYPPARGSSGLQRTLKYSRYLRDSGWHCDVLTVATRAHPQTGDDQMAEIPADVEVIRAPAWDTARHLSIGGRYPGFLASPDRWGTWWWGAAPAALRHLRRRPAQLLWSTFPIATAHKIGGTLHRLTGLPWIADFRDSMTEDDYPRDPRVRAAYLQIERRAVTHAARSIFTTPSTLAMYRARYPEVPAERFALIENGFDEENFASLPAPSRAAPRNPPLRLLHSGLLYPSERDPSQLFGALRDLLDARALSPADLQVVLRATGHDNEMRTLIEAAGVGDIVKLAPSVAYRDALQEMLEVDALLLLQAANCNHQIPAKLYEYIRAGRPIVALTDSAGDTAATLRQAGVGSILPLDDRAALREALPGVLAGIRSGQIRGASDSTASRFTRRAQAQQLASLFSAVCDKRQA